MTSRKSARAPVIKVEKKQVQKQIKNNKRKRIKKIEWNRKSINLLASIAVVLVLVIVVVYFIQNYHRYGLVANKHITEEDAQVIELLTSDYLFREYGNNILVYEKGIVSVYNKNANKVFEKKLGETFAPIIATSKKFIQIINKDTGEIYVLNGKYETARIKIEGTIISGSINDEGTSVIEYSTSGLKTALVIFDKYGNKKYDIKLDTNTLSTYSLSDDSRYLAFASVDISGISLSTTINIIDLLGNAGQNQQQVLNVKNELNYVLKWYGSKLYCLVDNSVVIYNAKNKRQEEFKLDDINYAQIGIDKSTIGSVVEQDGDGLHYAVMRYGKQLKVYNKLLNTPKHFKYVNGMAYICYLRQMDVYNQFGVLVKSYESTTIVTEPVVFNAEKSVAYAVSNKIMIVNI